MRRAQGLPNEQIGQGVDWYEVVEIVKAERLIGRNRHGQESDDNEEQRRRIIGQTAQVKAPINPQPQEHRPTADEQHDHRRERCKWNEERLGDDGIHHHTRHARTPPSLAQNAPPLLKVIRRHAVTSPP